MNQKKISAAICAIYSVSALALASASFAATQLPATIQAENFVSQNGIRLNTTSDTGGGEYIGWIHDGDYAEYDVMVPRSGNYNLQLRVASQYREAQVSISTDGTVISSGMISPTGSWESWKTVSSTLPLSSGNQTLKFEFNGVEGSLIDVNWFSLELENDDSPTDSGGTANRQLDNTDWTVFASDNSDNAYLAIDGDTGSRWTTNATQTSGQEFYIELGAIQEFDRIVLDTAQSSNDYPRAYAVDVSNDGSNWSTVAQEAEGDSGPTVIDFTDQNAAYIRITQSGFSDRYWWSIHEMSIYANSDEDTTPAPTPTPTEPPVPPTVPTGDVCTDANNLEACYERAVAAGGGTVVLEEKTYKLSDSILLRENVNIVGQGSRSVVTWQDSIKSSINEALFEGRRGVPIRNVRWENFQILCTLDRSISDQRTGHHGIIIAGNGTPRNDDPDSAFDHGNITAIGLEISNCSDGWGMSGATGVTVRNINLHHNSIDGSQLFHNLYFNRSQNVDIRDSKFHHSYTGHGMRIGSNKDVYFNNLEVFNNGDHGIHMNDGKNIRSDNTLIQGNGIQDNGWAPYACYGDCENVEINLR